MTVKHAVVMRINSICCERKLKLNELANICGVTPSTIYSLMDSSRNNINITTIKKICDGLELSLSCFFDSEEFHQLEQEVT